MLFRTETQTVFYHLMTSSEYIINSFNLQYDMSNVTNENSRTVKNYAIQVL